MGQRTDAVGRYDGNSDDQYKDSSDDFSADVSAASGAGTGAESDDTEEIRSQIEQTRGELSSTIDAIQEKLSPDKLKDQAKEMVREATVGRAEDMVSNASQAAKGFGSDMFETIKENPVPAAIAAIGLGWLFMKNSNKPQANQGRDYRGYQADYTRYGSGGYNSPNDYGYRSQPYQPQGNGGGALEQAQEKIGDIAGTAGDKVGKIADNAGETVGNIGGQIGQIGDQAQYKAEQAGDWFQRSLRENPMSVGAIALAVGAAVGLSIPETPQEHRIMGETRDNLVGKAQEAVQDTVQKVQRVAEVTQDTVQREVENQGLTPQGNSQQGTTQAYMG